MKTNWTAGLNAEQSAVIRKEYASSPLLRERLAIMLDKKLESSRSNARSKERYTDPSWAYLQADAIGYERALSEILSLITTKSTEK
jgi:hypothetical protein